MTQTEKNRVNRIPEYLFRGEADTLYGPAVVGKPEIIAFEREMAELSEKMVLEVMALFDDHEIELDYSEDSLKELDRLIDQLWPEAIEDAETVDAIVANWGAYLGETIIRHVGGKWTFRKDLDHASIHFARLDLEAFPLHVLRKRFQLGDGGGGQETLGGYYQHLLDRLTA